MLSSDGYGEGPAPSSPIVKYLAGYEDAGPVWANCRTQVLGQSQQD